MLNITELVRTEIKRQYKSLKKFSETSGIPYSTLVNGISRGIGTMSYDTVIKMCNLLHLKQAYDVDLTIFNDEFRDICSMLAELDDQGVHTVKTILQVEYDRCTDATGIPKIKSFNGLAYASEIIDNKKEDRINSLIKKIKN